jgi:hypothetical protein
MFRIFRQPSSSRATPLKPIAGIATTALLVGWAAGAGAQTASERMQLPPLPPAKQDNASNNTQPTPQQVDTQQQPQQAAPDGSTNTLPPLPLGRDGIREVQNQLIALGFDPGAADGQAGPVTVAAAQRYDRQRAACASEGGYRAAPDVRPGRRAVVAVALRGTSACLRRKSDRQRGPAARAARRSGGQ